ncbi:MAG TPA: hypothetical protein VL134_08010 [Leptolyngbya sp.]|jgi:hypothetical protein|nr:hypothetical protein [Leptolyngbya sp.]
MKNNDTFTSACRHCRFYSPEGRRGGTCSQLNVTVQSSWKACSLATSVFEPSWGFAKLPVLHREAAFLRATSTESIAFTQTAEPIAVEVSATSL